jgi:hypothetical protein
MDQEGAVGFEHEQANSFREACRETPCVKNFAASNEKAHRRPDRIVRFGQEGRRG